MLIYAHRGSSGTTPENTLLAFHQAIADGADGVELDVRATRDGVLVVPHDDRLDRTTDGHGNVSDLSYAELQGFDAGQGEAVPTLADVLGLLSGRLRLDLELKQAGIEAELLALLARFPRAQWAMSSFDWESLQRLRSLSAAAELWVLTQQPSERAIAVAGEIGATSLALWAGAVSPDAARRCAAADLDLVIWTVNDPAVAHQARFLGASALCTDFPLAIREALSGQS